MGLVSKLITPISHIITPNIPIINYLLSPQDPPSRVEEFGFLGFGFGHLGL